MQPICERHLSVVSGDALSRPSIARLPSLESQPFRPGELPTPLVLRLSEPLTLAVTRRAARAGVPVGLWIRTAVEAVRHVVTLAARLEVTAEGLSLLLDDAASVPTGPSLAAVASRRQRQYASALRRGDPSVRACPEAGVTLLAPDVMVSAWTAAAAGAGASVEHWVEAQLWESPDAPHLWEAAAAESSSTLAEWIYCETLRLVTRP